MGAAVGLALGAAVLPTLGAVVGLDVGAALSGPGAKKADARA